MKGEGEGGVWEVNRLAKEIKQIEVSLNMRTEMDHGDKFWC